MSLKLRIVEVISSDPSFILVGFTALTEIFLFLLQKHILLFIVSETIMGFSVVKDQTNVYRVPS